MGMVRRPVEAARYHMVISTGGTSGSYFPMGGAIANVITNYVEGASATAQTSGGSIENLKLIERGESEMGWPKRLQQITPLKV